MPLSHKQTHQLLQALEHQPRRQLGQNFLIDGNIVQKSLRLADLQAGERVVEVGPGLGTLTGCMLEHGARVYAVEFDKRLHRHLSESLQPRFPDTLDLLLGDAVDFPLANLPVDALRKEALATSSAAAAARTTDAANAAAPANVANAAAAAAPPHEVAAPIPGQTLTADFKIIANLPYAISTPWLEAVLSGPLRPRRLVLMLQKEAAERFVADHGSKAFGAISIFTASAYSLVSSHAVSRQCFYPIPGVDSVLLTLEALPHPQPWPRQARALVRQFFIHRRKQIGSLVKRAAEEAQLQATKKPSAKERAAAARAAANATDADVDTDALQSAPQRQITPDDAAAITQNLQNWLAALEQMGISQETRPEAIPLAAWQILAQSFAQQD